MVSITFLWPWSGIGEHYLDVLLRPIFSLISNCRKLVLHIKETYNLEEEQLNTPVSTNIGAQCWIYCRHPFNCIEWRVMLFSFSGEGSWCLGRTWISIFKCHLTNMCGVPDTVWGQQCEWYGCNRLMIQLWAKETRSLRINSWHLFTSWWRDKETGCARWGHSMNRALREEQVK